MDEDKFIKIQICYREYLWLLVVKEMEGDSAGGEMPVIAGDDGEEDRELWALPAGREVPTVVA